MNANPKNWSILSYTASITSCVLGAQKNALIETVLLSTQNTCFGTETKKREKTYSKIRKQVSSVTVTSENLNIFKTPPFLVLCAKILYPYNCASAQTHLSLICCNYVILCVVRCGERLMCGSVCVGGGSPDHTGKSRVLQISIGISNCPPPPPPPGRIGPLLENVGPRPL